MNRNIDVLIKKIDALYDEAANLAVDLIEQEARRVLKKHPRLKEFIMAMGGCVFTDQNGDAVDFWEASYLEDFNNMVNELDERFHITGTPMRFTATSEIVTEWGDCTKNPIVYKEKK